MATVGSYAHPSDTSMLGMSQYTEPATCYIQKNGCLNTGQTYGSWYWLSRAPMIRMNFGTPISSIYEKEFEGTMQVYPNPTEGMFTIELNDVENGDYFIEITNLLGQIVYFNNKNVNGFLNEKIDLSFFNKGIYFLKISSSVSSIVERIIVE